MPAVPRTPRIPYGPDDIVLPTKYRLIRRLGRGGFAEVWEAQNSFMDRIDAIKIVFPRFAKSGRYTAQQIAKEARIPNALRQRTPHVADVFDAGITDLGLPYIVMELLKGNTLRDHIEKRSREKRPIELKNIVGIACDVLHALSIAHKLGIVHLDVKPENIFLAKQFDQGVETTIAKLLDFGLAMLFEAQDPSASEDGLTGTPRYAAPEQFSREFGTIGMWTDTYAIGHVLYELGTGWPTFEQNGVPLDRHALEEAQLTIDPPDVREFRPDLPAALANLIRRCLRKHPSERPQSASEVAAVLSALDEALRGKRPLVSLAAISDFDLPLDFLKFNTTQPSPAPAPIVVPEPESGQFVQGPTYVSPHSQTEIPGPPSEPTNVSESFLTEPPVASAASTRLTSDIRGPAITVAPVVVIGSTEPVALMSDVVCAMPSTTLGRDDKTDVDGAPPFLDGPPVDAQVSLSTRPPRDDKTDPDGTPLFLVEPRIEPQASPPTSSTSAALVTTPTTRSSSQPTAAKVFTASSIDDRAPPRAHARLLPRYPILPGTGPMMRRATAPLANTSRPVAQRTIATEDRAPVVPLHPRRWMAPAGALLGIVVLGIVAGAALLGRGAATPASSAPAKVDVLATAAHATAAATPEASAPSDAAPPAASSAPSVSARGPSAAPSIVHAPPRPSQSAPQPMPEEFKYMLTEP